MEIANEFYQVALNRNPNPRELEFLGNLFDSKSFSEQQRAVLEDFVWAVVTCKEFVINH